MKNKTVRIVVIAVIAAAVIVAAAFALRPKTPAVDDPFVSAQEQVFDLKEDDIAYISVTGNESLNEHYFWGDELSEAIDALNGLEAESIENVPKPDADGCPAVLTIKAKNGTQASYQISENTLRCGDTVFTTDGDELSELLSYVDEKNFAPQTFLPEALEDKYARPQKQVFDLNADDIDFIWIYNSEDSSRDKRFEGADLAGIVDKLNSFEADKIEGLTIRRRRSAIPTS